MKKLLVCFIAALGISGAVSFESCSTRHFNNNRCPSFGSATHFADTTTHAEVNFTTGLQAL